MGDYPQRGTILAFARLYPLWGLLGVSFLAFFPYLKYWWSFPLLAGLGVFLFLPYIFQRSCWLLPWPLGFPGPSVRHRFWLGAFLTWGVSDYEAFTIVLRILARIAPILFIWLIAVVPHSGIPYVQIGFATVLYILNLFSMLDSDFQNSECCYVP